MHRMMRQFPWSSAVKESLLNLGLAPKTHKAADLVTWQPKSSMTNDCFPREWSLVARTGSTIFLLHWQPFEACFEGICNHYYGSPDRTHLLLPAGFGAAVLRRGSSNLRRSPCLWRLPSDSLYLELTKDVIYARERWQDTLRAHINGTKSTWIGIRFLLFIVTSC